MSEPRIEYIPMGPWPYFVGFSTSAEDFAAEVKRLKVETEVEFIRGKGATTHHFEHGDGSAISILAIEPYSRRRTREQYAALVAHEAVHVLQAMQRELGELGPEAEAYIVQHIVQTVLQSAWKSRMVGRTAPASG